MGTRGARPSELWLRLRRPVSFGLAIFRWRPKARRPKCHGARPRPGCGFPLPRGDTRGGQAPASRVRRQRTVYDLGGFGGASGDRKKPRRVVPSYQLSNRATAVFKAVSSTAASACDIGTETFWTSFEAAS